MNITDRLRTEKAEKKSVSAAVFFGVLFLLILSVAAFLFVNSTYFAVGNVMVEGCRYLEKEDVYRIAGVPERINIFRLNTSDIKSRLLSDLRIANADVTRRLPATILISVSERRPVAYLASNFGFVEVDKQGIILAAHKNIKQSHVPIITGFRSGSAYVGDKIDAVQPVQVLTFLAYLEEPAINQLSEVNIYGNRLTAYTTNGVNIRLGGFERLDEKAKLLVNILAEISQKNLNVEYIDLTYASPFIKIRN